MTNFDRINSFLEKCCIEAVSCTEPLNMHSASTLGKKQAQLVERFQQTVLKPWLLEDARNILREQKIFLENGEEISNKSHKVPDEDISDLAQRLALILRNVYKNITNNVIRSIRHHQKQIDYANQQRESFKDIPLIRGWLEQSQIKGEVILQCESIIASIADDIIKRYVGLQKNNFEKSLVQLEKILRQIFGYKKINLTGSMLKSGDLEIDS